MPTVQANNITMYYEVLGEKKPLILIMGLGGNLDWWGTGFRKHLAQAHQVIAFDNRGTGGTMAPDGPFSIVDMALDVVGLMDALEIAEADIFGVSMGGMIAQEVALRYPERVRRLILGCTSCGGAEQVPPTAEAMALLLAAPTQPEVAMENQAKILFPAAYIEQHRPLLAQAYRMMTKRPMTRENFLRQFHAIQNWPGSYSRLSELRQNTLLMHGTDDILLPVANSEQMMERLPHARLIRYSGAGHGFVVQCASQVLRDVIEFLED